MVQSNDRALPVIGESNEFGAAVGTFPVTEQYVTGRFWPLTENDQTAVMQYLQDTCSNRGLVFDLNDLSEPRFRQSDLAWSVIGNCVSEAS